MPEQGFKVAIVGCGKMATNHVDKVLRLVSHSNIALCDKEFVKAQLLGEMYGITQLFDSLDRLIEEFRPDVYHIVTPPATHKQVAVACMQGGGHIYIEKPVCLTIRDFDELAEAAAQHKRLVCAGHQRIFERTFSEVASLLERNELGRIIHIHAYDSGPYLEMEDRGLSKGWWTGLPGGMFADLLPHMMSVFAELGDNLKLEHSIVQTDQRQRPTEMHGFLGSGSSGLTCSFHISFGTKYFQNYYQIECEKGVILLNFKNGFWYAARKSKLPELVERMTANYAVGLKIVVANTRSIFSLLAGRYDPYEGLERAIERFYSAIDRRAESPTPIPVLRNIVELCEGAVKTTCVGYDTERKVNAAIGGQDFDDADILVTGAAGFIGTHLVRRLLQEGKTVRALSRKPIPSSHFGHVGNNLKICVGDLTNPRFARELCRGVQSVYHLAAATKGDLFAQVESTCVGTKNLLAGVKEHKVERLVYVSSVSVLDQSNLPSSGTVHDGFPTEAYPLKRGAYTYSKLRAEEMVRRFAAEHNIKAIILRPGIVWGPGSEQLLLETHLTFGSRGLIVLGRASKRLPLIYVENLVHALIRAGDAQCSELEPINVVDSDNPSQRKYLRLLGKMSGRKHLALFIPLLILTPAFWAAEKALSFVLRRRLYICYQIKSKRNRVIYSAERAGAILGWKTEVNFAEALARYLEWVAVGKERTSANAEVCPAAGTAGR